MEKLETETIININWGLPLPLHMAPVIFSKLPISNLPACRLVSKSWNYLVLDYASSSKFLPNAFLFSICDYQPTGIPFPNFGNPKIYCLDIDTLSSVASFEFFINLDIIEIVNSCNGLLYIINCVYHSAFDGIFNPMTGEFFRLPGPELKVDVSFSGFGFSPKTKQYKLVRISNDSETLSYKMEILTFGRTVNHLNHKQWRHVCLPFPITPVDDGCYLNGVLYWIGRKKETEYVIYALDVETEKVKLIAVLEVGPHSPRATLQPFNGTIYAIVFMDVPCLNIQVWRMQEKDSWIKDFVIRDISADELIHLVKVSEDGELLFLVTNDLFCLDKSGTNTKIKTLVQNERLVQSACHIESLQVDSLPTILAGDD